MSGVGRRVSAARRAGWPAARPAPAGFAGTRAAPTVRRMASDDGLVGEPAARMHRAAAGQDAGADEPADDQAPLTVDLDTYEAAHRASQWTDDEAPRARRRRTG